MVIFIDAFWCSLCFASMIVVYYVSIEASFLATFYPTIWRIFHIHHASINTAIGHSWSYFIWLYALRKCLKDARFAWYSATYMECKQPTEKRFLTDVLLFTHLMHLPQRHMRQNLMIINYDGLFTFHVGRRIPHKMCDYKYYATRCSFKNGSKSI